MSGEYPVLLLSRGAGKLLSTDGGCEGVSKLIDVILEGSWLYLARRNQQGPEKQ